MRGNIRQICHGAVIGAVYILLTVATWSFSSLQIQVRIAEALCIMPLFTPAAIPGLYVGCIISAFLTGGIGGIYDAIFGAAATLIAALITYIIGKKTSGKVRLFLSPLPAVVTNTVAVPLILYYGYGLVSFGDISGALPVLSLSALSVFIGQSVACYGLGVPLTVALDKINKKYKLFDGK